MAHIVNEVQGNAILRYKMTLLFLKAQLLYDGALEKNYYRRKMLHVEYSSVFCRF